MSRVHFPSLFMLLALVGQLLVAPAPVHALPTNQPVPASLVLGQADFTTATALATQSSASMLTPYGVAVDPATGAVFIADVDANRVLRFASLTALSNGQAADAVFGQPNFTSSGAATTRTGMYKPFSVTVDSAGRLWVADAYNHRVLRFDNAASRTNGAPADGVLGQVDFTSGGPAPSQSGMAGPTGVALDKSGRLWVADQANNRVLRFDNAASRANGGPADVVLGQASFTSNSAGVGAAGMNGPSRLTLDKDGRLWVADSGNSRVLRFDNAASKLSGANANGVLGQADFNANASGLSQAGFNFPAGVAVDGAGRLWVADKSNNRVLRFDNAAAKADGANADGVIGQVDFASSATALNQSGLNTPSGATVDDGGRLWVADAGNRRVLLFEDSVTVQITRADPSPTNAASLTFQVSFDGPVSGLTLANFSLNTTGTLNGVSMTQLSAQTASLYTLTVNSGTGDGVIRLDLANITNLAPESVLPAVPYTAGQSYTIDKTTPSALRIDTPAPNSYTSNAKPQIGGTLGAAEANATVTVMEGSSTVCSTTAALDGSWSCLPGANLSEALHLLAVTQRDAAGNTSLTSTVSFTVDQTAPGVPHIDFPVVDSFASSPRPQIGGTPGAAEPYASITVKEGAAVVCSTVAEADGSWACAPAADLSRGPHTLTVTQTDRAGNPSLASTRSFTVLYHMHLPLISSPPPVPTF